MILINILDIQIIRYIKQDKIYLFSSYVMLLLNLLLKLNLNLKVHMILYRISLKFNIII